MVEPERRCIVSRDSRPRQGLLRFVVDDEGRLTPDLAERLPGRGLYVAASRTILDEAVKKRAFSRVARRAVTVPDDLVQLMDRLLVGRLIQTLGLLNRAGCLIIGFEKARTAARDPNARMIIAAGDGAEDGRRKLRAAAPQLPEMALLSGAEIGHAVGRDWIVHGVALRNALVDRLHRDADRLSGLRGCDPAPLGKRASEQAGDAVPGAGDAPDPAASADRDQGPDQTMAEG